jgi:predicted Zn-ribbon and HTH transcriptional regulator
MSSNRTERKQTTRQQIIAILTEQETGARELSRIVGISEKEVYAHLEHIAKSVLAQRKKFGVRPSRCRICGFEFEHRRRLNKPGRCPNCKGSHLEEPLFRIESR